MKNFHIIAALITSIIVSSIIVIVAYFSFAGADYLLVIHFDGLRGIDWFGSKRDIFGILGVVLLITLINFILVGVFYNRDKFLTHLLAIGTVFFLALIFIAIGVIISIN